MATSQYGPTPAWEHALASNVCPCHLLLLALDAGQIIGWCRVFATSPDTGDVGIGLLAAYRDQGRGTHMLHVSIDWAVQFGYQRLSLTTRPDNSRALHVFEKVGFVRVGLGDDGQVAMIRPTAQRESDKEV